MSKDWLEIRKHKRSSNVEMAISLSVVITLSQKQLGEEGGYFSFHITFHC